MPIIRSWALTRGYALHPWTSCVASFTGSSRCWHGWRCVAGARRTSRSSSYGTSSACCKGLKIVKTPVHAPVANAFAERWIGSLRRELLDRTIIWNQRQREGLVIDYIAHYNNHRPHRSLNQRPPRHTTANNNTTDRSLPFRLARTTRCDGLINEYKHAA